MSRMKDTMIDLHETLERVRPGCIGSLNADLGVDSYKAELLATRLTRRLQAESTRWAAFASSTVYGWIYGALTRR